MIIYVIFLLVVTAAVIYLSLPFIRGDNFIQTTVSIPDENEQLMQLKDQRDSIKLALKDLDLENKIGKIDKNDFNILKKELLAEWSQIEEQLQQKTEKALKTNEKLPSEKKFCPNCGKEIIHLQEDRFCRFCGSSLKLFSLIIAFIFFTPLSHLSLLSAYEIRVKLINGSNPAAGVKAENISLLSLENSMQEIARRDQPGDKVIFTDLPQPQKAPYMIQAKYRGINYSHTVPPNLPSPVEVTLEVFEKTNQTDAILFRMLAEAQYRQDGKLHIVVLYYILNKGRYTFVGPQDGLEVFIPPGASDISASVSVGNGSSNIQWLRLVPQLLANDWYSLPYPIKPGERMYQLEYKIDYDPKGTILELDSRYPLEVPLKLILDPPDIQATKDGKEIPAIYDDTLNRELRDIDLKNRVRLQLTGGSPQKTANSDEVTVDSPLSSEEKIIGAVLALTLFLATFYYLQKNPSWLKQARERERIRLQTELKITLESSLPEPEKQKRSERLQERIRRLELYLSGRDEELTGI